jgi:hypothetical protein
MSAPSDVVDVVSDPVDHLGITQEQLAIVREAIELQELRVDPRIRDHVLAPGDRGEGTLGGAVRMQSFTGPLERLSTYRFQRAGILNEHLFHAWPGAGYDFPLLTTVVFEMVGDWIMLGVDMPPVVDVVFDREYYGRYYEGAHRGPDRALAAALAAPAPAEPAARRLLHQPLGSRLSVLVDLDGEAMPAALDYVRAVTRAWVEAWASAEPVQDPAARAQIDLRRWTLMKKAYKGLDYHSPAGPSLASVLGWEGANLMFDHVFGPDEPEQPLTHQRRYLGVDVSPGTKARQAQRGAS